MVAPKKKSKRQSVRLRHKIEKKCSEHRRKQKKLAKNDPTWRSKLKKDPGIPNLFPYKNRILAQIEESRRQKDEEAANRKRERMEPTHSVQDDEELRGSPDGDESVLEEMSDIEEGDGMEAFAAAAAARAREYERQEGNDMDEDTSGDEDGLSLYAGESVHDGSRKSYDKLFKAVVQAADVVLYVLDARDPAGTRSMEVEQSVLAAGGEKRLIYILNKADLVPPFILKGWMKHFRNRFPTLSLRASKAAPNAKVYAEDSLSIQSTTQNLLSALKAYANAKQLKRAISVGIIGYPNVGKSSIVNELVSKHGRSRNACPVGAEAGVTTSLREVKLDNKLKLIDCPGIVFPSLKEQDPATEQARLVLLNAVPPKQIHDPFPAAALILKRMLSSNDLTARLNDTYDLPALRSAEGFDITTEFLVHIARKKGRLGKHGIPDLNGAARAVINDWCAGRLAQWTEPPEENVSDSNSSSAKSIVSEWSKEFNLDDFVS